MNHNPLKVLIIGLVWPEPTSTGASIRITEHIHLFQQQGWAITFACAAAKNDATQLLDDMGLNTQEIALNHSSFDDFITALQPDIVLFDRYMMEEQFGWRIAKTCPKALRIIETIDLHCLREARHMAFKDGIPFSNQYLNNTIALREIASIYRADLSIIISDFEFDLLQSYFNIKPDLLHHCPFMLNTDTNLENLPHFEQRQDFMIIGNFRLAANWDAVLWLKQEIWPLIRQQLPQAQLHIYGAYTPPKATALHHQKEGFLIKNKATDVQEVMQAARVCLAPLRFGAGIKTKLADAMLAGTPSITTAIGAEGMTGGLDWPGIIANNPQDFADAAVKIYCDQQLWQTAQTNGFAIIKQHFNKQTNNENLLQRILKLRENLTQHRHHNFMGAMLNHHHHKSTEFMSRWIEAKNKHP